jgi:hypothetical protein
MLGGKTLGGKTLGDKTLGDKTLGEVDGEIRARGTERA